MADEVMKRRRDERGVTNGEPRTERGRRLYRHLFTPEERAALGEAAETNDLEQEVDLLRVLIRRAVADGTDLETVSRSLGRLGQLLRVQRVIRGEAAQSLDAALARALEEIGNELGM